MTDDFYAAYISMRAMPPLAFLADDPPIWPLTIVSLSENKLLNEIALPEAEQKLICGLQLGASPSSIIVRGGTILSETQLANLAIVRLARDPPPRVGRMQRRAAGILLRVYPHGFRFSGKNMTPLPCWLSGAQYVALNMGTCDLAVQLHFALFNGSTGYLLKPPEMKAVQAHGWRVPIQLTPGRRELVDDENYWPPPCDRLYLTTIDLCSLHNCPKRGEQRPGYNGSRRSCHDYHRQELSGLTSRPDAQLPSSPLLTLSLHPVGGEHGYQETQPSA